MPAPSVLKKENKPPTAAAAPAKSGVAAEVKVQVKKKAPAAASTKVAAAKAKKGPNKPVVKKGSIALKGKAVVVAKKKKVAYRFEIDCTMPTEDALFNCSDFVSGNV